MPVFQYGTLGPMRNGYDLPITMEVFRGSAQGIQVDCVHLRGNPSLRCCRRRVTCCVHGVYAKGRGAKLTPEKTQEDPIKIASGRRTRVDDARTPIRIKV